MKSYKILIDYKNFIPIEENEIEKAVKAFMSGQPVVFANGVTDKIHAILPDYHKIMGWNYGYELQGEDWGLIGSSKECTDAKNLIEDTKRKILGQSLHSKEISAGV